LTVDAAFRVDGSCAAIAVKYISTTLFRAARVHARPSIHVSRHVQAAVAVECEAEVVVAVPATTFESR